MHAIIIFLFLFRLRIRRLEKALSIVVPRAESLKKGRMEPEEQTENLKSHDDQRGAACSTLFLGM